MDETFRVLGFSGYDVAKQSHGGWVGALIAPVTDLDTSGLRWYIVAEGGTYKYPVDSGAIRGIEAGGTLLAGHGFEGDNYSINLLVGANAVNHMLSAIDPTNRVQGTAFGVKVRADAWVNPTPQTLVYGEAEYSTAFRTYFAKAKFGYDVTKQQQVFIGPEVAASGNRALRSVAGRRPRDPIASWEESAWIFPAATPTTASSAPVPTAPPNSAPNSSPLTRAVTCRHVAVLSHALAVRHRPGSVLRPGATAAALAQPAQSPTRHRYEENAPDPEISVRQGLLAADVAVLSWTDVDGTKRSEPHSGVDGGRLGDPILAPAAGVVIAVWQANWGWGSEGALLIRHSRTDVGLQDGPEHYYSEFDHLRYEEIRSIAAGKQVKRGEQLATVFRPGGKRRISAGGALGSVDDRRRHGDEMGGQ